MYEPALLAMIPYAFPQALQAAVQALLPAHLQGALKSAATMTQPKKGKIVHLKAQVVLVLDMTGVS